VCSNAHGAICFLKEEDCVLQITKTKMVTSCCKKYISFYGFYYG
jgi:hypothetical protein